MKIGIYSFPPSEYFYIFEKIYPNKPPHHPDWGVYKE
jgi:hypothetical protein